MKRQLLFAMSLVAACSKTAAVDVPEGQSSMVSIKNNLPLTENTRAWATAQVKAALVSSSSKKPIIFSFNAADVSESGLKFSLAYGTYTFEINYLDESQNVLYTLCEDSKSKSITIEAPKLEPDVSICGTELAQSGDSNPEVKPEPKPKPEPEPEPDPTPTPNPAPNPAPTPEPTPEPNPTPKPPVPQPVVVPATFTNLNGSWWLCIDTPPGTVGRIGGSLAQGVQILFSKERLSYTFKIFTYSEAWCNNKTTQPTLYFEDNRSIIGGEVSGTKYIVQTSRPTDSGIHELVTFDSVTAKVIRLTTDCDRKDGVTGAGTNCSTYNRNFDRIGDF